MTTWLLLDTNYLAYRALHSTGTLSFEDNPTGVIYGVVSEVLRAMERFGTYQCCWCFDYGKPIRSIALPGYKSTRKAKRKLATEKEKRMHKEMKAQLNNMRTTVLPELGFRNIFAYKGFEADDVIASLSQTIPAPHKSVMVSSDEDLYQLLDSRCLMWNPHKKKVVTADSFRRDYGIEPAQWVDVKAIAGCSSDDVPGVDGVGEKTAIKYLTGQLVKGKVFERIIKHNRWQENLPLVRLPYEGCPYSQRRKDRITKEKWCRVMRQFGFTSLERDPPIGPSLAIPGF